MRVVKKLAGTLGIVLLCAAAGLLVLWLAVSSLLRPLAPALDSMSPLDLRLNPVVETRFTPAALEQAPEEEPEVEEPQQPQTLYLTSDDYPKFGELIGNLRVEGTVVDCNLYYGDSEAQLSYGAGLYAGAWVPGESATILAAGHTGSFFRDFESAELGALVTIETYYGEFVYEIIDMGVYEATDPAIYDFSRTDQNLIMYTCYPFNQLTYTPYRYVIYGAPVSGPEVIFEGRAGA